MQSLFEYSTHVKKALDNGIPVVAMESTVISHGLPYPDNVDLTHQMIEVVEQQGAVAAIIAVDSGNVKIGLNGEEIEAFAKRQDVLKLNRADIGLCLAQKQMGATTVAATAHLASLAHIKVFATGGIGGVHQGVVDHYDISNDLMALSQTPIVVVSSGIKSILDVAKTLEVLETFGVPVIGFQAKHLPLFYCHSKKYPLTHTCSKLEHVADAAKLHWQLNCGGLLMANPIPAESALDEEQVELWIEKALSMAKHENITGKAVTPFVLSSLVQLSDGETLKANKALLIDNARVAANLSNCW